MNVDLYVDPIVIATCLALGKIIKSAPVMNKISNSLIPFILLILGIGLSFILAGGFTGVAFSTGIISAAAAIGLHQTGKPLFVSESKLGNVTDEDLDV